MPSLAPSLDASDLMPRLFSASYALATAAPDIFIDKYASQQHVGAPTKMVNRSSRCEAMIDVNNLISGVRFFCLKRHETCLFLPLHCDQGPNVVTLP